MKAQKLRKGDKVCVIAPARSMGLISDEVKRIALDNLKKLGLDVVFSEHCYETDDNFSSSVQSRVSDLHAAFADSSIKGIFTVIGGFNSNQLLSYIDYKLIKKNPKIVSGFSDITALSNAIYTKTGLITYYGPHFSSLGMKKGLEYTIEYLKKCLMSEEDYVVKPSEFWSDEAWFMDQENRHFFPNEGPWVINPGEASGTLIGGNLCTFNLLQGTSFMPDLKNTILMLEDDNLAGDYSLVEFDRNLQSLIQCKNFSKVKGLIIGRFQKDSKVVKEQFIKMIKNKKELSSIPVIANMDFGHTTPIACLPVGAKAVLCTENGAAVLKIVKH